MAQTPINPQTFLAAYEKVRDTAAPFQLWIGEAPIITDSAPSTIAALPMYALAALTATGIVAFVPGTHTGKDAVITAVEIKAIGQAVPYYDAGKFNHEAIVWPAGAALDTLEERKVLLNGSMLRVGHLLK